MSSASRRDRIEAALTAAYTTPEGPGLELLEVLDESHQHSGGPAAQSHFRVLVVSPGFSGQSAVQRHRQVQKLLSAEFAAGMHALAINAWTPEQWQQRIDQGLETPKSPACLGGSKS